MDKSYRRDRQISVGDDDDHPLAHHLVQSPNAWASWKRRQAPSLVEVIQVESGQIERMLTEFRPYRRH